jgi:hypothetical protein
MFYSPLSGQLYEYERGLSVSEHGAAAVRAGEAAAALRDLRLRLGSAFGLRHRARPARGAAAAGIRAAMCTQLPGVR